MEMPNDCDNADTISISTLALEEFEQKRWAGEISELNSLSKKVRYLHTSLLYYRNIKTETGITCYEAWKALVKKVGGTSNCWRDLGSILGIQNDDLDYIMNYVKSSRELDSSEIDLVLKVFMQNDNATLDKVLDALVKLKRYDILKAVEGPVSSLHQCFNKDDSGYQSNSNSNERKIISFTKNLHNDLPSVLNKSMIIKDKEPEKPDQDKPILKAPITVEKKIKTGNPVLLLTFTEDGLQTAYNIQNYVNSWIEFPDVRLVTLNEKKEKLYQNPEKFIREYFEQATYIVPIITPGYIEEIRSHNSSAPNTNDNLDYKYVNFIYTLIINNYVHATGCLNKKVRSVLPRDVDVTVLRNIALYPDLLPYTYETNFDEQFQAFLKRDFACFEH